MVQTRRSLAAASEATSEFPIPIFKCISGVYTPRTYVRTWPINSCVVTCSAAFRTTLTVEKPRLLSEQVAQLSGPSPTVEIHQPRQPQLLPRSRKVANTKHPSPVMAQLLLQSSSLDLPRGSALAAWKSSCQHPGLLRTAKAPSAKAYTR